jgi:hypothetical protein
VSLALALYLLKTYLKLRKICNDYARKYRKLSGTEKADAKWKSTLVTQLVRIAKWPISQQVVSGAPNVDFGNLPGFLKQVLVTWVEIEPIQVMNKFAPELRIMQK